MEKVIIFGAGNIGRGFAGQLFSESGYEVVFIDINMAIIDRLNKDNSYPVYIVSESEQKDIIIGNVRGVDGRDLDAVAKEIVEAKLMAVSVGMNALKTIAKSIAYGIKVRWQNGNMDPLNIILFENMFDADKYVKAQISSNLDLEQCLLMEEKIGVVKASIGRMVPTTTKEMQEGNPLQVYAEAYSQLPVDEKGFRGEIPYVKNMIPYSPFDFYVYRKLFMHNMGHVVSAYLGYLKQYKYIWEAISDKNIRDITCKAFDESAYAISKEYNISLKVLTEHRDDLLNRFANKSLGDTVDRVCRDPIRKLYFNDRLVGAANLCEKHDITPIYICLGIAVAFMYKSDDDESSLIVQDFIDKRGIEAAITNFCNLDSTNKSYNLIIGFYRRLANKEDIKDVITTYEGEYAG